MTFTISRDKNIINFLAEDKEQPYAFDINTGILYSLKSKPLKNFPSGMKSYLKDYRDSEDFLLFVMGVMLDRCYNFHDSWSWRLADFQECANLLSIADKINSLGYTPSYDDVWRLDGNALNTIGENLKAFARYCKETEEPTIFGFLHTYYPVVWAEQNGIEVNEVITIDVCREIMRANFSKEQIEYLIKCFRRGVPYFYMRGDGSVDTWSFIHTLRDYYEHCEMLDLKYDKDFFRGVALANRMYQTHKQEIDNRKIANQMNKHNYDFENDNFTIVVPQTTKDFLDEATHQNNCVYNIYMNKVAKGDTNVVFIRKKSNPSKSYITCEITNRGYIQQYLLANNNRVRKDTAEYDFKVALQKWLEDNWE